jgi:hypothetical protein
MPKIPLSHVASAASRVQVLLAVRKSGYRARWRKHPNH